MPRVADHDERRANIARAFQRLVAEHGLAAATFAGVAREAGVSIGSIQHYFPDRAAVMRYSYEHGATEMMRRVHSRVADGELKHETIATMTLAGLEELLPLDDVRRGEAAVLRSLLSEAPYDEDLATVARAVSDALRGRLVTAIANGKTCGEVPEAMDEVPAAVRLLAVTKGLGVEMATHGGFDRPQDVAAVLQPVIATVFPGRCRRHA